MRYLGGKTRIAKDLAEFIATRHPVRGAIIEPFMGGGNMTVELAQRWKIVESYDVNPDLILLWQALQNGWQPPKTLSAEEYDVLKHEKPSALRGFAGFGCSYAGKFFGGYARPNARRASYVDEARRGALTDVLAMKNVTVQRMDFSKIDVKSGDVIYADPPYSGTTDYSDVFSPIKFWFHARRWVNLGATVYVSEYRAPPDFECVWTHTRTGDMSKKEVTEKLFMYKRIDFA